MPGDPKLGCKCAEAFQACWVKHRTNSAGQVLGKQRL